MDQETYSVKIKNIIERTHNVRTFQVEKPSGYHYTEGQATEVSIDTPLLHNEKRPFTFTSLNTDPYLEFTIKMYGTHENGMTKHLRDLTRGDFLLIRDVRGAIHYKGKGVFIAWGAWITPFISILRKLRKKWELRGNTLIFSNKMAVDIILREEWEEMEKEGLQLILTLTREDITRAQEKGYLTSRIDKKLLEEYISDRKQHFYLCGPAFMVDQLQQTLIELWADIETIVFEG